MSGILVEMAFPLIIGIAVLAGLATISLTALAGWRDWIALQRERIAAGALRPDQADGEGAGTDSAMMVTRIEMADMRERLRKLEAIAAGVDL